MDILPSNVTDPSTPHKPNMGGAQFASHVWMEPIVRGKIPRLV